MIILCPHCFVIRSTNPKVQPDCCSECGTWYRVVLSIENNILQINIVKHFPSDSIEEPLENPTQVGRKTANG